MISDDNPGNNYNQFPSIILSYKSTLKNKAFLKNILALMNYPLIPIRTQYNNSLKFYVSQNNQIKHNFISIAYDSSSFDHSVRFLSENIKENHNIFCFLINTNYKKYEPFIIKLSSSFPRNTYHYITTSPVFMDKKIMHKGKKFIYISFDKPHYFPLLVLKIAIDAPIETLLKKKRKLRIDKNSKRLEGCYVMNNKKDNSSNDNESKSSNEEIEKPITARNILIYLTEQVSRFIQENETDINEVTNYILKLLSRNGRSIKHKNIERRVYDIINVMKAIGIIDKNKNSIITFINNNNSDIENDIDHGNDNENDNELINNDSAIDNTDYINYKDNSIKSQNEKESQHVALVNMRQTIEEKRVKLLQQCKELLFYKTIVSKNKAEHNSRSSMEKLFFPLYLFKCNSTMSFKQNNTNTQVIVFSKEKIDLLETNALIKAFRFNSFNIHNIKEIVSKSLFKYIDETNLLSSECDSINKNVIFDNEDNKKETSSFEQKSFELMLDTDSINLDYNMNINNMMLIKPEDAPEDDEKDIYYDYFTSFNKSNNFC